MVCSIVRCVRARGVYTLKVPPLHAGDELLRTMADVAAEREGEEDKGR